MNTLAAFGFRPHLASMADMESVAVRAAMCPAYAPQQTSGLFDHLVGA
jgi:hypothetical protein